eukprot:CAMPEP_0172724106 /NCGR_PEP_ID=MMETSP1074-20121228/85161_1 /TAXON_ID=2916 /ORGANISM="Ceratium fusus, Strain PA161109" /LENGTH=180 /DNA_ID=CAMNT_0013550469 /DNA_START=85 /DNA_END=627 /DNA_ORIENTATION=+
MALIACAGVASVAALASVAVVRLQKKTIEELEDKVKTLHERAQQLESLPKLMSAKRREVSDGHLRTISELEAKHGEKDQHVAALQEQVEDVQGIIDFLEEKADQFEGIPKLMSVKRQEAEDTTRNVLGSLEEKANEKDQQLAILHRKLLTMLEQLDPLDQNIKALEARQEEPPVRQSWFF